MKFIRDEDWTKTINILRARFEIRLEYSASKKRLDIEWYGVDPTVRYFKGSDPATMNEDGSVDARWMRIDLPNAPEPDIVEVASRNIKSILKKLSSDNVVKVMEAIKVS